jgi:hypothetical protein
VNHDSVASWLAQGKLAVDEETIGAWLELTTTQLFTSMPPEDIAKIWVSLAALLSVMYKCVAVDPESVELRATFLEDIAVAFDSCKVKPAAPVANVPAAEETN